MSKTTIPVMKKMYNKNDNYLLLRMEEKKRALLQLLAQLSKYHRLLQSFFQFSENQHHLPDENYRTIFVCLLFKQRKQNVLQKLTVQRLYNKLLTNNNLHVFSNEVYRKTDTLFPGNNTTAAKLKPLTIRSGGSSSNH